MLFSIGLLAAGAQSAYDARQDDRRIANSIEIQELKKWKTEHMEFSNSALVSIEHRLTSLETSLNTTNNVLVTICVALVLLLVKALLELIAGRLTPKKGP